MPSIRRPANSDDSRRDVIPFPRQPRQAQASTTHRRPSTRGEHDLPQSTDEVLAAFATMSRRINDLARELKCLGYFDEDDDRPRAA